jgi:hypothetical protein
LQGCVPGLLPVDVCHRSPAQLTPGRLFPTAEPLSVAEIMKKVGVEESLAPEILDVVALLQRHGVVEVQQ